MTDALIDRDERSAGVPGDRSGSAAADDAGPVGRTTRVGDERPTTAWAERFGDWLRTRTLANWLTFGIVTACVLFVFWQFQPPSLFSDTTPTGGDMSAHVWGAAFLRDHLLPKGRLSGWSPDWYAGFP